MESQLDVQKSSNLKIGYKKTQALCIHDEIDLDQLRVIEQFYLGSNLNEFPFQSALLVHETD